MISDWNDLIKISVALLAIVNPFGGIPVFLAVLNDVDMATRRRVARTIAVTVFVVLALADLSGDAVLQFFGISVASFMVGGGILLLLLAVSMLQATLGRVRQTPEEATEAGERQAIGVVPIGIPLLAGPGAISSMIIYAQPGHAGAGPGKLLLLLPVALVALSCWATFLLAGPLAKRLGTTGLNILTRIMGLLLAAVAVEIIARGLVQLFPGLR